VLLHLALVAVFGILIPWWKGVDFFDPVITAAYACMGMIFAAPAAAQAFAANRPQSMKEAFLKAGRAVLYGESLALTFIVVGTATVSLTHGPRLMLPEIDVLGVTALLGLAGSCAVAGLAGWVTLRFSATAARMMMRLIFLGLLIAFFYSARRLPDVALTATAYCIAIAAGAVLLLRREVIPR
jgi:hypothetical protein